MEQKNIGLWKITLGEWNEQVIFIAIHSRTQCDCGMYKQNTLRCGTLSPYSSNSTSCLWPFALNHVIYIRNRVQHSAIGKSPYQVITRERPDLKHIRVFGCTAYALQLPRPFKFSKRALEGIYLETAEHGIFKTLLMEKDNVYGIVVSRHFNFNEIGFLGARGLEEVMDDELSDDDPYSDTSADYSNANMEGAQHDHVPIPINNSSDSEKDGEDIELQNSNSEDQME